MKKLNKLVLHKAKIMTVPQMKAVTGGRRVGYDGDGGAPSCGCYKYTMGCRGGISEEDCKKECEDGCGEVCNCKNF